MTAPQTQGGRALMRGDSYDIECWRTTHRLRVALGILRGQDIVPTPVEHSESCILHPSHRSNRVFGWNYICDDPACPARRNPPPTWPEWVTGEMFDRAYALADEIQTERGRYEQRKARELRSAS
jgi:hypothetical protein